MKRVQMHISCIVDINNSKKMVLFGCIWKPEAGKVFERTVSGLAAAGGAYALKKLRDKKQH